MKEKKGKEDEKKGQREDREGRKGEVSGKSQLLKILKIMSLGKSINMEDEM